MELTHSTLWAVMFNIVNAPRAGANEYSIKVAKSEWFLTPAQRTNERRAEHTEVAQATVMSRTGLAVSKV
eukprot:5423241-Amphidinium_carterae.1